jgi:hypothetical protein
MIDPRLRLVVVRSLEVERLAAFYRCVGIKFVEEQHGAGPRHLAAEVAGVVLEIYPAKTPEDVDRTTRLGFSIPDLQGAIKALEKVGAGIGVGPQQTQWGLRAVVKDPDGRSVELYSSEAAA